MIFKVFRNLAALAACALAAGGAAAKGHTADDALLAAYDAYRAGDPIKLAKVAKKLEGHVLEPWLDYWRLSMRLEDTPSKEVREFLATHANLYVAERLRAWETSKQAGPVLKPGLLELRDLRNRVAREMGYSSFFHLQVADYGMSVAEMRALTEQLVRELRPLYQQLHCWARYRLAERYGQPVPKLIPAHWLPNRWGQEWSGLVESIDLDAGLKSRQPECRAQRATACCAVQATRRTRRARRGALLLGSQRLRLHVGCPGSPSTESKGSPSR